MAYPTVDRAYGYKPVNLIGGQPFSGSTRMYPIAYNYGTSIFFGDPVTLTLGYATLPTLPVNSTNVIVGIFLGCYYTNPATKQRLFSQFYPASTLAGDITAIVADDPDVVLRCAVTASAGSTVISSASSVNVGVNLLGNSSVVGSIATGNSTNGVIANPSATPVATSAGFRVLQLATDTQVSYGGTYSSGTGTTSLTVTGMPPGTVIPVGAEVFNVVFGGLQYTGSFLTSAYTVPSTGTAVLPVTASTTAVTGSVAVVVTPEVLVKINFGVHRYNLA